MGMARPDDGFWIPACAGTTGTSVGSGGGGTSVGSGGTSVGSGGTSVGCTGSGASVVAPPHAVINIENTIKDVKANHPNLFFEFIFSPPIKNSLVRHNYVGKAGQNFL